MKKQGDAYLKLTGILLAALLLVYGVCALLFDGEPSYTLQTAAYCEVGDGITVSGFVVRSECYVRSDAALTAPAVSEGERVAAGQTVAVGYASAQAQQERQELLSLQRQRAQLVLAAGDTDAARTSELDEQILQSLIALSRGAADGDLDAMAAQADVLKPLVLRRSLTGEEEQALTEKLQRLDERIFALVEQTTGSYTPIAAPAAGYYSAVTDGYEEILTPSMLSTLNLAQLRSLDRQSADVPEGAVGRLITGQTWYYVTEAPLARIAAYEKGDRLDVSFAPAALRDLRMTIEFIGQPEGESCLLVLSCNRKMQEVTALRYQSAEIEFASWSGIRVPRAALREQEGQTGVYVLSGARARWKPVEVLCEYGDDCLVAWDSSNTATLWPKDELILTAGELSDGMVIE